MLAGQGRFAAAEAELLAAEQSFATAPSVPRERQAQCLEALATLYASWDAAEPGRGHGADAATWRGRVEAFAAATPPPAAK